MNKSQSSYVKTGDSTKERDTSKLKSLKLLAMNQSGDDVIGEVVWLSSSLQIQYM